MFGLRDYFRKKSTERTDKRYLGAEIARLHLVLKQHGIQEKVRLPIWLKCDSDVMRNLNMSDVVDIHKLKNELPEVKDEIDMMDLKHRSN